MVIYVDAGNGNEANVFNPYERGVPDNLYTRTHIPRSLSQAVWSFGPRLAHMWKFWTDREDRFTNLMSVVQNHLVSGIPWFQRRGAISTLDAMTVGRGGYSGGTPGMSEGQYRIEVFHYAILASPMVMSFDISTIDTAKQVRCHAASLSLGPHCRYTVAMLWKQFRHTKSCALSVALNFSCIERPSQRRS